MTSEVSVVLEYLHPWTNSAGFFVASTQGWYAEQGLDVDLRVVDPARGDPLEYLARGAATFAVFPTNRLLVRREAGQDLVAVAAINHRAMETLHTLRRTGITRPRDLEGRRIAFNPTPRGRAMVRHLVAADGGDPDAVIEVDTGSREYGPVEIAAGEVDATFGNYWAWDVLLPNPYADEQVVLPIDELGAPRFHSYLLGASRATLDDRPDVVRRFLAATERGYLAAVERPALALEAFETYLPYWPRDTLRRSLALISTTWLHEGRWGHHQPELHEEYATWLWANGILRDAGTWRDAVTDDYLAALVSS